tara:strand:+ start:65 stop:442 length:378 start_codon:yes stop_codon:yes gene_type:complete
MKFNELITENENVKLLDLLSKEENEILQNINAKVKFANKPFIKVKSKPELTKRMRDTQKGVIINKDKNGNINIAFEKQGTDVIQYFTIKDNKPIGMSQADTVSWVVKNKIKPGEYYFSSQTWELK